MTTRRSPSALPAVILTVAMIVVATVGIFYFTVSSSSSARKAQIQKQAAELKAQEDAKTHPPVPRVLAPAERLRTSRTFDIPAEGLRLWLEPGSDRYPLGGGVKTLTPSGRLYVDRPGVNFPGESNSAGWFTFLPDPLGSKRQIEIYNRW